MNDDFLERAKRKAQELGKQLNDKVDERRDQLSPRLHEALDRTQAQAEDAIGELGGLLKKAAKSIRDDVNKRS
ncbi:MAG TPA: hypothetical protein VIG51_08385 [Candidatus Baltobacteraceae bacterium]|jgi:F0F1-type ATP synthase membrane subunit b/b'